MKCSDSGKALIKSFELLSLQAYKDQGGEWTIGWGHTGKEVHEGLGWTQKQCNAQFERDVAERAEVHVNEAVKVPLSQGQFDALCSLCFNIGGTRFRASTLVKKLNAGDVIGAARQFVRWKLVKGSVSSDLLDRRAREIWEFARASPPEKVVA